MTAALTVERRRMIAAALFALWIASLALPAVTLYDGNGDAPMSGADVLKFGWIAIGRLQLGWLANPALILTLWLLVRPRAQGTALRSAAAALALFALQSLDLFVHPQEHGMGGAHAGYFLWLGVSLAAAGIVTIFSFQSVTERHDQPV